MTRSFSCSNLLVAFGRGCAIRYSLTHAVLAVGILQGDLAVAKREKVATMNFDAGPIRARSRERPLRNTSLCLNKVARVTPMGIRESSPHLGKTSSHRLASGIAGTTDVRPGRGLEHAVLAHERHERIDVVAIPCIGERLQDFNGDLAHHSSHDLPSSFQ